MKRVLLGDTSVIINLMASGRFVEIANAIPWRLTVCRAVVNESLYLWNPTANEVETVCIQKFLSAGLLDVWEVEAEAEQRLIVQYAALIDDGEAACFALAQHRGSAIAIDDIRAIKRATQIYSKFEVISTPQILMDWVCHANPSPEDLRATIANIESRARYRPGKNHLHYNWWEAHR